MKQFMNNLITKGKSLTFGITGIIIAFIIGGCVESNLLIRVFHFTR